MAKHIFIVTVETSATDNKELTKVFKKIVENWLDNVSFVTQKKEQLISLTPISKIERTTTEG